MINLAVINKKDLIRYILKFTIFILIIIVASKVLVGNKENFKFSLDFINEKEVIGFLDETIPGISQLNTKENNEETHDKINPLELALKMELGAIDTTKKINLEDNNEVANSIQEEDKEKVQQAKTGLATEVVPNNVPDKFTNSYNGVQIKNSTDYNLTEEMLKPDVTVNNKNVLIFHTHTCESYTASEKFNYTQTGTYRTTDYDYNVVRVGTELENQLKSYNYNVIHDKTYHDYPAYNGSYGRSLETVENILSQNRDIDVVLDIHRDAIGDYSYAPKVKIGDEYAAQLMFVIGTDGRWF